MFLTLKYNIYKSNCRLCSTYCILFFKQLNLKKLNMLEYCIILIQNLLIMFHISSIELETITRHISCIDVQ